MATFYKKKDDVKLQPGQTLGYTAGKGYFAAGRPTAPKPPASATAGAKSPATPTATRPRPAKTPTEPPRPATAPTTTSERRPPLAENEAFNRRSPSADHAQTTPRLMSSESAPHYAKPRDVPILPGQSLGFAEGRGFYAAGRQEPSKASTTPNPSNVKITALSTRASTESPLVEHVETDGERTTITLSHRDQLHQPDRNPTDTTSRKAAGYVRERSPKPRTEESPNHKTMVKTRKASPRVHEELALARRR